MKKYFIILVVAAFAGFFMQSCERVLNKENLSAVNPSDVWSHPSIAQASLDMIYLWTMPGYSRSKDNGTDEEVPFFRGTTSWLQGTATYDSYDGFDKYWNIRYINIFIERIDGATFDETSKSQMKGQAFFWRAWCYNQLVKSYGGVPLILEAQLPTDNVDELAMPREKTSVCVTQILKDLDDAIALLPASWSGNNVGRIDKGAAMALKGRVLLFFASPLFNGLGGVATWQKAYDVNKAAVDFLKARGNGLYRPYSKIWDDELNKEVIMVKRCNDPENSYFQGGTMPLGLSGGNDIGDDHPSLELVDAFPMKDGSSWNPATMSYDTLFKYRDDRFYANIYYNGSPNQYTAEMRAEKTYLWTYYHVISDYYGPSGLAGTHNQVTPDPLGSNSSFYRIKAVDKDLLNGQFNHADVDVPEIRFAEVLMNYGECANELGKTTEAKDVLYQIRDRAGIEPGSGNYGITATSVTDLREVYKKERFVEFCFEGKRMDDLRRWKMFGYLRSLPNGMVLQFCSNPEKRMFSLWTTSMWSGTNSPPL